jgi:hypothetical protein
MDAAERELLASTVRDAIAGAETPGAVDGALAQLGWLEMLDAEPRAAIEVVFSALGATGRAATALDDVLISALGITPRPDLAVLLPPFGAWLPPGHIGGERCQALGLTTGRVASAREVLVVASAGLTDVRAITVAVASAEVERVQGIDPDAGFHIVRVEVPAPAEPSFDRGRWDTAVAVGQRAVAHQISGACRTMLDLARTHALERIQFGRPIASFQAVRHRLAETLVAIEGLDATLDAAGDEPNPLTAALAKASAGRSAAKVVTHCQQVLAGIGFTTDHPFHRYLKRTMALDGILGSADEIAVDVGRRLLAERRVPKLIEL